MIRSIIFFIVICILYFINVGDTQPTNKDETKVEEFVHKGTSRLNRKWIYKCCPEGQFLLRKTCVKRNIHIGFPKINVCDENVHRTERKVSDVLTIVSGRLLDEEFKNKSINPTSYDYIPHIIENGDLQLEVPNIYDRWTLVTNDCYCVDYTLTRKGIRRSPTFLVLMEDEVQLPNLTDSYSPVGLVVSSCFLFIVLVVYILLPELRNICGKILMACVFSLLMASSLMAAMEFTKGHNIALGCIAFTSGIYYFLLASFCWMSVMSFDIWWTFRSYAKAREVQSSAQDFKFRMYSLFAWGVPLLMTVGLVVLNNADMKHLPWFVTPQIPDRGCFLENGVKFLYLYIPMLILITLNWIFYIMTAFYLRRLSRGTAILNSPTSPSGHNTQRNRLMMYLKLSVVMGLNWIFEILSFKFPRFQICYLFDFFNIFIGFTIFLIFVCKMKIFRMLHKRYVLDSTQSSSFKKLNSSSDDSNPETTTQHILSNSKRLNGLTSLKNYDSDVKSSQKFMENVKFIDNMNSQSKIVIQTSLPLSKTRKHPQLYEGLSSKGLPRRLILVNRHPTDPCYPNLVFSPSLGGESLNELSRSWLRPENLPYPSVTSQTYDAKI